MDITVQSTAFQAENRSWLRGPHGTEPGANPTVTLDVTKFTPATHYPNGFIPSGTVIAEVTAAPGTYGPYDSTKTDGTQTAKFLLFGSVAVPTGVTRVAGAGVNHANVNPLRLPFATGSGSLDTAAKAALPLIITA